ncbi:MAG: ABC transporter permease [Ferruginibacter sp.]
MQNKTGLIISREYFTRVKKKSFLLTTILVPLVIMAFYAIIIAISVKGSSEKKNIALIDEAGLLKNDSSNTGMTLIKNETENSFIKKYKEQGFDGFLYIPPVNIDSPRGIRLHSRSAESISVLGTFENKLNKAIENERLKSSGIKAADYERIASDIDIENTVDTEKGSKKSGAKAAYIVSFACGILIYMMMIIYGTQVMRGVSEEKTSRIAEVIVSSVRPFQLMTGKIIGIGAVGLTQFAIWIVLMLGLQMLIPLIFPEVMEQISAGNGDINATSAGSIVQEFSTLPVMKIMLSFIFYFLAGYLTYASLFAAVGSMATDDQQDTQQLIFPILMPIILGFVIMTKAVADPQSSLAVFGSLFPLTSPIVMMGRISYDVPGWQIALSMVLLVGCFLFLTWVTAKVYRVGILMYGKKPSWKEMLKWAVKKT